MSKQRMVDTCYWDDTYVVELDCTEKLVFLYLLTNPLTALCGVYEVSTRRMALDTGIDKDMVEKILARFERDGRCIYRNGWVAMRNWIKHQRVNPSVEQGIDRELAKVPEALSLYVRGQSVPSLPPDCTQDAPPNSTKPNSTQPNSTQPTGGAVAVAPAREPSPTRVFSDLFYERSGHKWANGGKEGANLARLVKWAKDEQPARWEEFLRAFMDGAWELVSGRVLGLTTRDKEWWKQQPYTPSSLLGLTARIMRVLEQKSTAPPDADAIVREAIAASDVRAKAREAVTP